jgi:hypothetical protein
MDRRSAKRLGPKGSRPLACGLAALLLLLGFVSASGALHRSFHHGQRQDGVPCAVCLLVKCHLESTPFTPVVLKPEIQRVNPPRQTMAPQPLLACLSTPSRAPPDSRPLIPVAV